MNLITCIASGLGLVVVVGACMHASSAEEKVNQSPNVSVKVFNDKADLVGPVTMPRVVKTDAEWQKQLSPESYKITRLEGTELPGTCGFLHSKVPGVYTCICCGLPLFKAEKKFDSGTGWPSFFQPIAKENVVELSDGSFGMTRTEVRCARCGAHLGHVFDDGPAPTGLRYCMNGLSLTFTPDTELMKLADPAAATTQPAK